MWRKINMPTCPICNETIEYKDILFAVHKPVAEVPDSKFTPNNVFSTIPQNNDTSPANTSEADKSQGTPSENNTNLTDTTNEEKIEYGVWQRDDTYNNRMKEYLYMDNNEVFTEQAVFAVKWDSQSCHGTGAAMKGDTIPAAVKLCEEDAKEVQAEFLTGIICPHCHSPLIPGYIMAGKEDICRLALLGGSRAGKTQYILAAYQNLMEFLVDKYGGMVTNISTDLMSKKVMQHLENEMKNNDGKLPPTQLMTKILPIVFEMEVINGQGQKKYLIMYDIPGEAFTDLHKNELVAFDGILKNSDALMILADGGTQVFSSIKNDIYQGKDNNVEMQESCTLSLSSMISQFCSALEAYDERKFKSVSVVVSKFDKVVERNPEIKKNEGLYPHALNPRDSDNHQKQVNKQVIAQINNEMRSILGLKEKGNTSDALLGTIVKETIPNKLQITPHIFAVSTYNKDGNSYKACDRANLNRHRVLEPILYALAESGILPYAVPENGKKKKKRFCFLFFRNK